MTRNDSTAEMSQAHIFMTWTDPYPSQQTCDPTRTHISSEGLARTQPIKTAVLILPHEAKHSTLSSPTLKPTLPEWPSQWRTQKIFMGGRFQSAKIFLCTKIESMI